MSTQNVTMYLFCALTCAVPCMANDNTMWTWVSGADTFGIYGTKGIASLSNGPGVRYGCVSGTDSEGNLWLFGGDGTAASGNTAYLNDLWKFDGTNWTWVSGSNTANQNGVYGTKGVSATSNVPGARGYSVSWRDSGR
jgi:hypothetical protein